MIRHRPPDPIAGIPLRKLMRDERICSNTSMIITFAVIPLWAVVTFATNPESKSWLCCSIPVVAVVFFCGLRYMGRYSPDMTEAMLTVQLQRYGDVKDLAERVAAELADGPRFWAHGRTKSDGYGGWPDCWVVTNEWLMRIANRDLRFVPLDDVLWVHKRIVAEPGWVSGDTFHRYLCVVTERGLDQRIRARNEAEMHLILKQLISRRPALLCGFTGENLDLLRTGKAAMRAHVERRRKEWESLSEDGREDWLEDATDDARECVQRVEAG